MIINSSFMYFFSFRTVLLLFLFSTSILVVSVSSDEFHQRQQQLQNKHFLGGRRSLFEIDEFEQPQSQKPKKKSTSSSSSSSSTKNQTKLIKPSLSTKPKNQTKLIKTNISSKNQTIKLQKLKSSNSTKPTLTNSSKSDLKKLNSPASKPLKTSDPLKNKTKIPTKQTQTLLEKKETTKPKPKQEKQIPKQKQKQPSWLEDEDDDLVSEFRDLPTKFQRTLLPDLERISTTSKAYLDKYNKEITKGFKPFVGHKYASTIASICSFLFILVPLVLVSLIFNRIKAYFSIQKILIFIQALPRNLLLDPLPIGSGHGPGAAEVFLRYIAVHVCVFTGSSNARLRVVLVAASDVFDSRVFDRLWAGLEDVGPGPNVCGLCGWASLLRGGVS
ncbi:hypothetical protein Pint_26600 [Pistacia integerrima]|uniref:Uncharacterized protein n=1 Tax=Pistacia integerrima TaxID=434235 RepID=A0ACC0YSI3_9ROSI|nr:hypothetical protein Pint_26600 [Pistacia integerrima]